MAFIDKVYEALERRGNTLITRIKAELRAAGKSATGSLMMGTEGVTKIQGTRVVFEGRAPEHYVFVDKGRRPGAKPPPVRPIQKWIRDKGLDLNGFAVAKSIGKKGIKPTNIYTNEIEDFKRQDYFGQILTNEIIKEIKIN